MAEEDGNALEKIAVEELRDAMWKMANAGNGDFADEAADAIDSLITVMVGNALKIATTKIRSQP